MISKYVNPFTDFGFKKLFGEEASKPVLIDFLNAVISSDSRINDIVFKNTEQFGDTIIDRKAIYDIFCDNDKGEKFIVELQKAKQNFFKERTVYYSTYPIRMQAVKGEWDFNLKAVFCIGILDFKFESKPAGTHENEVLHTIKLSEWIPLGKDQNGKLFYDKLTFIYLELPNFLKEEEELETRLDKWLYFIKKLETFEAIPEIFKDDVIFVESFEKAAMANYNEQEKESYENSLKVYWDINNIIDYSFEQGVEKGMEKGIEIGEANKEKYADVQRKQEKLQMAKNCLADGMGIAKTAQLTGLTEEEVGSIKI